MSDNTIERALQQLAAVKTVDPAAPAPTVRPARVAPPTEQERAARTIDLGESLRAELAELKRGARTAEEFRIIKRPLLMWAFTDAAALAGPGNLILVTSAFAGEGKTYSAIYLALSIARELDRTVLLIDSDLGKGSLTRRLGLQQARGLSEVLSEEGSDIGAVILNTSLPKLKFIPAGQTHPHATEYLASERMRGLCAEMAQRYGDRVVLFDGTPLLETSQASVVTHLVGQVVLVVEAGKTAESALKEAIGQIAPERAVSLVLNKATSRSGYGGYYGQQGHGK